MKQHSKSYRRILMGGASLYAVALAAAPAAHAANFSASDQASLYQAIADAQASADPQSTITLTGSFSVAGPFPSVSGKAITVDTGANTLTFSSSPAFDIAANAALTVSGQIGGAVPLAKTGGAGGLVLDATGGTFNRLAVDSGDMLINGGGDVTVDSNFGATAAQVDIAGGAGSVASLTISGQGTRLLALDTTDPTDISNGTGAQGTLTIEDRAYFKSGGGIRVHTISSGGTATINVTGAGSTLEGGASFGLYNGTSYVNVLDGGLIDIATVSDLGGVGTTVFAGANVTAVVSGAGSEWDSTTFNMNKGTLSILDGGVVAGTTVNIATGNRTAVPNFSVLVSGAGSELTGNTVTVGTFGTGIVTIADKGRVAVNNGAGALTLGGANVNSHAVLNIGGAEGEAAAAAGTLDASKITLAASAAVNFNHTEDGYAFDIPIVGAGDINQVAGRTIFTADQLGFTGLATVYGGVLEVNGALGGTMEVRGGVLAGTGSVGPTTNFAGGSIAPGSNGIGTLTINGPYTGSGGLLSIETVLGDDSSATDLLQVSGDTSGDTSVRVTNLGGAGGQTAEGIKIVNVDGVSGGTFSLLGDYDLNGQQAVIGGAYAYQLFQGATSTPDDGDWYLRSVGIAPTTPVYEAVPSVFLALAGAQRMPTLRQRVGALYSNGAGLPAPASAPGAAPYNSSIWTRIEGAHDHVEGQATTGDLEYDLDSWLVQAGFDGLLADTSSGLFLGGLNFKYANASADVSSTDGDGSVKAQSYGFGATLTWYGDTGFYVDGQANASHQLGDVSSDLAGKMADGVEGWAYGLSLEAGRKMGIGGGWALTPQAQLAYTTLDFTPFDDEFGSTVALDGNSLKGRVGAALDFDAMWNGGADKSTFYAIANLNYEFLDGPSVEISGTRLAFTPDGLGGELGVGGTYAWAGGKYALHGEMLARTSFEGSYGYQGTGGLQVSW